MNLPLGIMNYKRVTIWMEGFLKALETQENVSKNQINTLLEKIDEIIEEIESLPNNSSGTIEFDAENDDDLPF